MDFLASGIRWIFDILVGLTSSYGVAIILVTILIRLVLLPLTLKQTRSMEVMKQIQPKLKEVQEKYKDDPKELQERSMKLYKDYKVNPLGGCLPMLVQLPVLIGFFRVLQTLPESDAAIFLGFWDLTVPDPFYILPILAAVTQYLSMQQTMTDSSQKTMMMIMPVMIGFFSLRFPAGLVLYWVVGNIFSIIQQAWISKQYLTAEQGGETK